MAAEARHNHPAHLVAEDDHTLAAEVAARTLAAEVGDHTLAAEIAVHSLAEAAVRSLVEAAVRNLAGVAAHIPVEGHVGHILTGEAADRNLAEEAAVRIPAEEGAVHIPAEEVAVDHIHRELHTVQAVGLRTALVVDRRSRFLLLDASLAHPGYHMKNLLRPVII